MKNRVSDLQPVRRASRGDCVVLRRFRSSKEGAIAVEMALITPFVLGAMLVAGQLGFEVYKHQKIHSAAYAGASYLQDQLAQGEFYKLRAQLDNNGNRVDGDMARITKLVIKDASGLPLDLDKINVSMSCACPKDGDAGGDASDPGSGENTPQPQQDRNLYYDRTVTWTGNRQNVCKFNCSDGTEFRIIADIEVTYTAKSLLGGDEDVVERLVTRLR